MRLGRLLLICASIVHPMFAAEVPTRFLVPLNVGTARGLQGTVWATDLAMSNQGDQHILVGPIQVPGPCQINEGCLLIELMPQSTLNVNSGLECGPFGGCVLDVYGPVSDLSMVLRTHDTTRENETFGTVVPVVQEKNLLSSRFSLTGIPMDPAFRATLRIYDIDPATPPQVRVRVYSIGSMPWTERQDALIGEIQPRFLTYGDHPTVAENFLWLEPLIPGTGRIRIEIEPLDGRKDYWAFVSVTHNTTQHVTVITP